MIRRVEETAMSNPSGFPHYSDDFGRWVTTPDGDWTGGFWVGLLSLSYLETGREEFLNWAKEWMRKLRPRIRSETVFKCFLFYYGAAVIDLLFNEKEAADLAVEGARSLQALYNPSAGVIPLGREAEEASSVGLSETNIDSTVAVALLCYASEKTGDQRLRETGINHALANVRYCVRGDGSVIQSASFNTASGEPIRRYTHKGYGDNTIWGRAQAWAMLGLSQAVRWAPERGEFIEAARRVTEWWIKNVSGDYVAFWDFNDPRIPNALKDTSATSIAAASMLKLSRLLNEERYRDLAVRTLNSLSNYVTPVDGRDDRPPGMLTSGCYNRRIALATNNELVWGDYYLLESLLTLKGTIKPFI